jgi:hypothetical protein
VTIVILPIAFRIDIDDDGQRSKGGAVPLVEGEISGLVADGVAEKRIVPRDLAANRLRVGVEEQLVRVEAQAAFRFVGSMDAVAVELAGADVGKVDVPDARGAFAQADGFRFGGVLRLVEEAEIHGFRALGKEGEVCPLAIEGGSLGER